MRTDRSRVTVLEDLPNVGPAIAADFRRLGIRTPAALKGRDPYALYAALNRVTGQRHDPCVLPRAVPMVEAMTALVLVDHALRQKAQCG